MPIERSTAPFSRQYAAALRGYIAEQKAMNKDINQPILAKHMSRSEGYISERLSGLRAVDTDMVDAVAELVGVPSADLHRILLRRASEMPAADRELLDRIVNDAVENAGNKAEAKKKAAEAKPKTTRRKRRA